ncbi:hypothetical protein ILUMI_11033 [Ignelater luminosus]|uniref:Uncharacterized protein n=1 Tax=Ignelater luminosus TaxID=2038154 RepID=A0A8K0G842_IGNLU|nr:hypothetical protein ILUMI_11033 [Ignelater luminosus]
MGFGRVAFTLLIAIFFDFAIHHGAEISKMPPHPFDVEHLRQATALLNGHLAVNKRKKNVSKGTSKLKVDNKRVTSKTKTKKNEKGKALPKKKKINDDSEMDCDIGKEDAECIFCSGLFSEDTADEEWIRCSNALIIVVAVVNDAAGYWMLWHFEKLAYWLYITRTGSVPDRFLGKLQI